MPKSLVPNQFDYNGIYVEGKRSTFRFHKPVLASCMSGMLVPAGDPIPIFPGVKTNLMLNAVIRSNTMVVPPLDGIYIDFFSVWIPHRIVWNHMPQFLGENDTTAWTQSSTYVYPYCNAQDLVNYLSNSVINESQIQGDVVAANNFLWTHYGFGSKTVINSTDALYNKHVNVLAARGYYSLWNYFFRDENYQRPVLFDKGDTGTSGEFGYLVRQYNVKSGSDLTFLSSSFSVGSGLNYERAVLMPVNKFHDAFTSLLPQPQFGSASIVGIGATADIKVASSLHDAGGNISFQAGTGAWTGVRNMVSDAGILSTDNTYSAQGTIQAMKYTNLVADLGSATAITINQLRSAVMYQRYLEALARGGRRVTEYYESIYGVKNSEAGKDYPKMISHTRYMLGVNQVIAQADSSGSGWTSHLGDTGAYSLTNLRNVPVSEMDFTEFGYLHVLYAIRADNRYSQMLPEHFFRSTLLDEYNPFFDHIGDVDVPNYLVNMNASASGNFGFQEAWWFERTQLALCTGALNKSYGSLAYWTLGEVLDSTLVTCTPSYLCFDPGVFNDVFVSAYYTYPQFIIDLLIHGTTNKRMSQHSIPGIVGRI